MVSDIKFFDNSESSLNVREKAIGRIMSEWDLIDPTGRGILFKILSDRREDLRKRYLNYLVEDTEMAAVIATECARHDFTDIFMQWVDDLLRGALPAIDAFCQNQTAIGQMMARINLPPQALSRAMRKLKLWFLLHLEAMGCASEDLVKAIRCLIVMVDLSVEIREASYESDRAGHARIEEAYRLQALGQNLAMERERQRAALMEWSQDLLTCFYQAGDADALPSLAKSDFGLWLDHKARIVFEGANEIHLIVDAVHRIDEDMIPQLSAASYADRNVVGALIGRIQEEVAAIKFGLNALFDARLEIENGRDTLTHLLNRRFLPTVLMREIALQRAQSDCGFCIAMLDIDRFKAVNDRYGHLAGDAVLQQVAGALNASARPSDFTFRYGGEEMVLVLINCDQATGHAIAERVRACVQNLDIILPNGQSLSVTASLGVAAYEGELDYEVLLARADKALYKAKSDGRNRVVSV